MSFMTKEYLSNLVTEKSIKMDQNALTLILSVLLKYGIAPIACIYLGYVLLMKDGVIQKNTDTLVAIIQEQTVATTKQTLVMENLTKNIEANTKKLEDLDRKSTR